MKTLAIDPGKAGGMAWLEDGKVSSAPMPKTLRDTVELLRQIKADQCWIERVHAMKGQGVTSCFTFGRGVGQLEGILVTLGTRLRDVTPQKWQKEFQLGTRKDFGTKSQWKNHLKDLAQRLYPDMEISLNTADALLILHYVTTQQIADNGQSTE